MRVSKQFWVSDEHLDKINKSEEVAIIIRNKDESSFHDAVINKAVNKITISYEIDREVTIKESEFEKYLQEWDLNTPSIRITDYLKEKLFGGGENE